MRTRDWALVLALVPMGASCTSGSHRATQATTTTTEAARRTGAITTTTLAPPPGVSVRLGQMPEDFEKALGAPEKGRGPAPGDLRSTVGYRPCGQGGPDQITVNFDHNRAVQMVRAYCGGAIGPDAAKREATAFFPGDAAAESPPTFAVPSGGTGERYRSAALGATTPAYVFRDCAGAAVPPGIFSFAVTGGGWTLYAGACP